MDQIDNSLNEPEGVRERKKRLTLERIAETSLKLFVENGYEATTLDAIATAAGISRRTFFYYYKSKEDALLGWQEGGFSHALQLAMIGESPDQEPLDAVRACLLKLTSRYETKESIIVDGLLTSIDSLRARMDAFYIEMERTLVEAMSKLWGAPEQRDTLRTIAMMAMGTLRLALEDWRQDEAKHPLAYYLQRSFANLEAQL